MYKTNWEIENKLSYKEAYVLTILFDFLLKLFFLTKEIFEQCKTLFGPLEQ